MIRSAGRYSNPEITEVVFEIPMSVSVSEAIQEAKRLSNEYLTSILENVIEGEPHKLKKLAEDSDESLE